MTLNKPKVTMLSSAALAAAICAHPVLAQTRSSTPQVAITSDEDKSNEIVVTAQRREERLQDVPQSVSVVAAETLSKLGATQFRDFADTVPGLSFSTTGTGFTQISMRGVTTGSLDIGPTVGLYLDEVPVGSSSAFAEGPRVTLDAGLFDLDRIEVLRGPQGTLYGASSMGGVIKYVGREPSLNGFASAIQAGISSTHEGGLNYNAAFTINAPVLSDRAAIRATAFHSHDDGYVDNVATGTTNVNNSDVSGGRVDFLVRPSSNLKVRLTGFLQNISRDGEGTVDYLFSGALLDGDLDQRRQTPEPYSQKFRLLRARSKSC